MKSKDLFLKSPIKWAGGKSKLMNKIEAVYNEDFVWKSEKYTYIELFGGGGIVLTFCWLCWSIDFYIN
jgi:site-specific DNA-adenine methylase